MSEEKNEVEDSEDFIKEAEKALEDNDQPQGSI